MTGSGHVNPIAAAAVASAAKWSTLRLFIDASANPNSSMPSLLQSVGLFHNF
ncbi:hypothetical protein [Mesorhizobium sp. M2E.F.Ca.ET.154.01.1.1]|uniref:hypothetical protein n=1 Tax=Mesorhizobium sp. M2E.F.Ca.ET.154.01.1.1 TaxID=2500521 RepID=UPI001AEE5E37|nr:hypothetical protein [Mesorhizobium sp. M2E.F.Ca.ET.154.01.1.1]